MVAVFLQGSFVYWSRVESQLHFLTFLITGKRLEPWIQIGNHRTHRTLYFEYVINLNKIFFKALKVKILLPVVIIRLLIDAVYDMLYYSMLMPCHDKVMMQTLAN